MARPIVGVTIGDGFVRAVELLGDQPHRVGEVPLADGVVVEGVVAEEAALAEALRALWQKGNFSSKRVAIGIETEAATIRRVTLPALADDEIADAAAYDIADVLGFPSDEAVIGHSVLTPRTADLPVEGDPAEFDAPIDVLVVAVRVDTVEALARVAKAAGLRWTRAELGAAATVASLDRIELPDRSLGAVASIGELTTTVAVHDAHGILFARVLMTGVGAAASLSHELESQLAELESLRSGGSGANGSAAEATQIAPGVSVVAEGIRRTLQYFSSDIDNRPIDTLVLTGPRSRSAGLVSQVADAMPRTAVSLLQHTAGVTVEDPERFDTAIGVARLASTDIRRTRDLCLVPKSVVRRSGDRRALLVGSIVAALLVLAFVGDGVQRGGERSVDEEYLATTEQTAATLRAEIARLAEAQEMATEIVARRSEIEQLVAGDVAVAAVLGQIAEAMPPDAFITSVRIDRSAAVGVEGQPAIDGLATLSIEGAAPSLDGVGRWMEAVDALPSIDQLWLTQSVFGPYGTNETNLALFNVEAVLTADAAAPPPQLAMVEEN